VTHAQKRQNVLRRGQRHSHRPNHGVEHLDPLLRLFNRQPWIPPTTASPWNADTILPGRNQLTRKRPLQTVGRDHHRPRNGRHRHQAQLRLRLLASPARPQRTTQITREEHQRHAHLLAAAIIRHALIQQHASQLRPLHQRADMLCHHLAAPNPPTSPGKRTSQPHRRQPAHFTPTPIPHPHRRTREPLILRRRHQRVTARPRPTSRPPTNTSNHHPILPPPSPRQGDLNRYPAGRGHPSSLPSRRQPPKRSWLRSAIPGGCRSTG
jgi:hypothetical protein